MIPCSLMFGLTLSACGGASSSTTTSERQRAAIYEHCRTPVEAGFYERVVQKTKGVNCLEAAGLAVQMSRSLGPLQVFEAGSGAEWECRRFSHRRFPLLFRCNSGGQSFKVEKVPMRAS